MQIRIINGLGPCAAVFLRHDRSDDIHQLRQAGHLHAVGMFDQGDQHQADKERVLKGIVVLQKGRSLLPGTVLHGIIVPFIGMEPYVPLIEAEIDILFPALFRLHIIAGRDDGADKVIHLHGQCKEVLRIVVRIAEILMKGDEIHIIIGMLQRRRLPLREGRHLRVGAAAGYKLNRRIDDLQRLRRLSREPAVLHRRLRAELPGAVHLIAQAPYFDSERILHAVADAQVRILASGGMVAVFQQIAGVGHSSCAEVDRHHNLGIHRFRPFMKLIQADLIGLHAPPGKVQSSRPLTDRADAVLPDETGYEITSRIADDRNFEIPDQLHDVPAEPILIRARMSRLVDPGIDCPPQVFDKGAVDSLIDAGDPEILINNHFCEFFHANSFLRCSFLGFRHLRETPISFEFRLLIPQVLRFFSARSELRLQNAASESRSCRTKTIRDSILL